jgi:hypothetical protein
VRSVVENPIELIKIRRQTLGSWQFNETLFTVYRSQQLAIRCLLTNFFIFLDVSGRHVPQLLDGPVAPFFKGGICATLAWWTVWPLEVVKSQIQAASKAGASGLDAGPLTIAARFRFILRTQGIGAFRIGSARRHTAIDHCKWSIDVVVSAMSIVCRSQRQSVKLTDSHSDVAAARCWRQWRCVRTQMVRNAKHCVCVQTTTMSTLSSRLADGTQTTPP